MKRVVPGSVVVVAAACAGGAPTMPGLPLPDWRGSAVNCRHLGDGGIEVEMVAPTAGFRLDFLSAQPADGNGASVVLQETRPTADFVAQVITPLRVTVPAERLGAAAWVAVYIVPFGADSAVQLAVAMSRPARGQ